MTVLGLHYRHGSNAAIMLITYT